jgi:hypothetical protein
MSKWIAEFELEDGDTMPEHMDLEYEGAKIDFRCRPMWIPVTERLPEKEGWYLVTSTRGNVNKAYLSVGANGSRWVFGAKSPLAWMPLPEPYKEDIDG